MEKNKYNYWPLSNLKTTWPLIKEFAEISTILRFNAQLLDCELTVSWKELGFTNKEMLLLQVQMIFREVWFIKSYLQLDVAPKSFLCRDLNHISFRNKAFCQEYQNDSLFILFVGENCLFKFSICVCANFLPFLERILLE